MSSVDTVETPTHDSRTHYIELLQVISVIAIPLAVALGTSEIAYLELIAVFATIVALSGFILPFLLVKAPAVEQKEEMMTGEFAITEDRLVTFEVIQIPVDVRQAMKKYMLGIKYDAPKLRQALFAYCGEERVRPYVRDILRHTLVVEPPREGDLEPEEQPSSLDERLLK